MNHECDRFLQSLDAQADNALSAVEQAALASHAHGCVPCHQLLVAERERVRLMAALPRALTPGRDLWPTIATRVDATHWADHWADHSPARAIRTATTGFIAGLAAAATVVLLFGSSLFLSTPRSAIQEMPVNASHLRTELDDAETEYRRALQNLSGVLERSESTLPVTTQAVIRDNLAIIDRAITETRAELARDPIERRYAVLLGDMYVQKAHLLRLANRIAS